MNKDLLDNLESRLKELGNLVENSAEKISEIRTCEAAVRSGRLEEMEPVSNCRYIRDDTRVIISAPEIIIGDVDRYGNLLGNAYSKVVLRGHNVELEGVSSSLSPGDYGSITSRAASIRNIAVDPGFKGESNVVCNVSEIVNQAKAISLNSSKDEGSFVSNAMACSGISIESDTHISIDASESCEVKRNIIESDLEGLKQRKEALKEYVKKGKDEINSALKDIRDALEWDLKQNYFNEEEARSNLGEYYDIRSEIENTSSALSSAVDGYVAVLSNLAEVSRRIKCLEDIKEALPKSDDFQKNSTGAYVRIQGERINLASIDGDGNIRTNQGAGVGVLANATSIVAKQYDDSLLEDGTFSINARNINLSTANTKYSDKEKRDDNAEYPAEGSLKVTSKLVAIEGVDYELKDKKINEKALTKDSLLDIRMEKVNVSATDTEGKAAGGIVMNAKEFELKAMDVKKDDRTDDKLSEGGSVLVTAEKLYAGSKDKDRKTKKLQIAAEETGIFGGTTAEMQQGEAKALVQLSGGNLSVSGSKTELFGETTVNGKSSFKAEIAAPKATIDNIEAKSSFKSTNISDGVAVPAAPSSAKLSAKLELEEKK
ncbi:MAG: hypothetical protein MJY76_01390 [Bacteroidales bacterium]|nr:hypothetical protein [Bacteroidales bacterium]